MRKLVKGRDEALFEECVTLISEVAGCGWAVKVSTSISDDVKYFTLCRSEGAPHSDLAAHQEERAYLNN